MPRGPLPWTAIPEWGPGSRVKPPPPIRLCYKNDTGCWRQPIGLSQIFCGTGVGFSWAAIYNVIGTKLWQIPYSSCFYKIFPSEYWPVWLNAAFGTLFLSLIPLCGRWCSRRHVLSSFIWSPWAARLQTKSGLWPLKKKPRGLPVHNSSARQLSSLL